MGYTLLKEYIEKTNIKYDIIIRLRFDQFIWTNNTQDIFSKLDKYKGQILFNKNKS
mgnify:CR=1 FL=1